MTSYKLLSYKCYKYPPPQTTVHCHCRYARHEQVNSDQRDALQVPMTISEVRRGMRMRASATEALRRGISVAQPMTAATKGKVPSFRHMNFLNAAQAKLPRDTSVPPVELLFWPGAWRLTELERYVRCQSRLSWTQATFKRQRNG